MIKIVYLLIIDQNIINESDNLLKSSLNIISFELLLLFLSLFMLHSHSLLSFLFFPHLQSKGRVAIMRKLLGPRIILWKLTDPTRNMIRARPRLS